MVRENPDTIKWRQALPPVFVFSVLILFFLSFIHAIFRYFLGLELFFYFAILLIFTFPEGKRALDWRIGPGAALAIVIMHVSWGSGFLWSMVKSMVGR
jgi:hypothetical protein